MLSLFESLGSRNNNIVKLYHPSLNLFKTGKKQICFEPLVHGQTPELTVGIGIALSYDFIFPILFLFLFLFFSHYLA